jgi:hypothetical protein
MPNDFNKLTDGPLFKSPFRVVSVLRKPYQGRPSFTVTNYSLSDACSGRIT